MHPHDLWGRRFAMAATVEELETQARQLPVKERGDLIHRLILSLDEGSDGSPEEIAKAWDEEIGRRVAAIETGTAVLISQEEVFSRLDAASRKAGA